MNIQEIYICPSCNDEFDSFDKAADCCPPDIGHTFRCGECGQDFDEIKEASLCCVEDGEGAVILQSVSKILAKSGDLAVVKFASQEFGLLKSKEQIVTWATEAAARQFISLM